MANLHSWMEVKEIMVAQAYPAKAMSEDFPPPLLLEGKVPPYFYFYKPDNKPRQTFF